MGAVAVVVRRRLAGRWRALLAAGLLLGIGYGVSMASVAAARRTASAYDRLLVASDAPDAAVALGPSIEASERSLQVIPGVTRQRVQAGYLGRADGVEPLYTTALLAPTSDVFPLQRPHVEAGRLPDPDAPNEAFINANAARAAGLHVGNELHFTFFTPTSKKVARETMRIVGIGTYPLELARDETNVLGVVVFTRAFYDAHPGMKAYATSNVDLAPGVDARADLAPAAAERGYMLQSTVSQERRSTRDALRPLVIALVALGLLAFVASVVATAQVIQRDRDRWRAEGETLLRLGMVRSQLRRIQLTAAALIAALALGTALVVMVLASPLAPIGPLHGYDPAQGVNADFTVVAVGGLAVLLVVAVCALAFTPLPPRATRSASRPTPMLATIAPGPATLAGLTLALRPDGGRVRIWRAVTTTVLTAILFGGAVASVVSAVALIGTPARYGFDADLLALNQYGDQPPAALTAAFAGDADVAAATGFTNGTFLIGGTAVPGLAMTPVKGDLAPTILEGDSPRAAGEIALGKDTLESVGAEIGDLVPVQLSSSDPLTGGATGAAGDAIDMRVVGVAVFPPVNQAGSDVPRLGVGALVTRDAFLRLDGVATNEPEFTSIRLVDGADPAAVLARHRDGFTDSAQTRTTWFIDTQPAELRQLDAAMPYLRGAVLFGYLALFAVVVHALWTRVRAARHDLAVLRALGSTRRQLDEVTAWQAAPFAVATVLIGLPVGLLLGQRAFTLFADSLAVVDTATVSGATYAWLAVAVVVGFAFATLVSIVVSRRLRVALLLRED